MQVQHENNTVVKDNTHDRCLVRGLQVFGKVGSSALSAELSYKGGVTNTIPVNSSIYHQSHFNTNAKSKVNYLR